MRSVLLRLEGPLQSWGTQGKFTRRDTDREPSKSGVLGLVGSALGMPRDDDTQLARLRQLEMAVRVDREGELLRDYHTVGAGKFRGEDLGIWSIENERRNASLVALTDRYYLTDASFVVALGSNEDAFVSTLAEALRTPRWPLFLGRRACAPTAPVFVGVVDTDPIAAVRGAEVSGRAASKRLRLIVECAPAEGTARQDVPLSFASDRRSFSERFVRTMFVDLSEPT